MTNDDRNTILTIGAGSMGRRRLRDLTYLNPGQIILFEPDAERCHEISTVFGVDGLTELEDALRRTPTTFVISTPPSLHELYVRLAIEREVNVFAEVPFVLKAETLAEIANKVHSYPAVLGISHTVRYYPPCRLIRDLLQRRVIGKPLYLEFSEGYYLPDWHPYEDYRKFYASDVRLGGAGMDMILHEISTIQWWLGRIDSVYARLSKVSLLEINGPDTHDVLLTFANGARGFFHHDLIERGAEGRHVRIVGEDGTLEWHENRPFVRLYEASDNKKQELLFSRASDWDVAMEASGEMTKILASQKVRSGQIPLDASESFTYESCYLREMRHFLDAIRKRSTYSMASINEELQTVLTFHSIVESSDRNQEVKVPG